MQNSSSNFNKSLFFDNIFNQLLVKKTPNIDLHLHTNWTDGAQTVSQMHKVAEKKGCTHILFSEHSRKTSGAWFNKFANEVRLLNQKKCVSLVGTEVKVLDLNGNIDLNTNIKKKADLIMVSVHRFPGESDGIFSSANKNTNKYKDKAIKMEHALMESALINKNTDILGHPFGMSIKRFKRKPKNSDFESIIKKCKMADKAFEINSHYHYNHKWLLKTCLKYNVKISLGSNAHTTKEIAQIYKLIK
tara:strand:- start:200 stop:937 length:738 start_codon:yes stop_codon:yes gene_type:complete